MTATTVETAQVDATLARLSHALGVPVEAVPDYLGSVATLAEASYQAGRLSLLVCSASAARQIRDHVAAALADPAVAP